MYWKKVNKEMNESEALVKTLNTAKELYCSNCGFLLLKRPFDVTMKANGKYDVQKYDYHCAVCNLAFDRFSIEG